MKLRFLMAAAAALFVCAPAEATTNLLFDPETTDTGQTNDFNQATDNFADYSFNTIEFVGSAYGLNDATHLFNISVLGAGGETRLIYCSACVGGVGQVLLSSLGGLRVPTDFQIVGLQFTSVHSGGTATFQDFNNEGYVLSTQAYVPEPATWAMMLLGFGAIGAAARRSKRKAQATFA